MATSFRNDSSSRRNFSAGQSSVLQQRLHQLQGHARAAQILLRISAVRPVRIEDGQRRRQFGFGQMMIGDDDVDPEPLRAPHHLARRECPCRH